MKYIKTILRKTIKVLILLYYKLTPELISLHLGTTAYDHDFTIFVNRYPVKDGEQE